MDRALAGLIVVGVIAGYGAGMLALDWLLEQAISLGLRCWARYARANR